MPESLRRLRIHKERSLRMFRARLKVLNVCSLSIVFVVSVLLQIKTGFCADQTINDLRYDFPENDDPGLIGVAVGYFDFAKQDKNQALDLRLEFRPALNIGVMRPWAALETTNDGSIYAAGGILVHLNLSERWVLTPSVGAGGYHRGDGKDLGSVLQFRVQGDIAYRFENGSRLALSVSHLSNARTSHHNPGAEIISLYYFIPVEWLF